MATVIVRSACVSHGGRRERLLRAGHLACVGRAARLVRPLSEGLNKNLSLSLSVSLIQRWCHTRQFESIYRPFCPAARCWRRSRGPPMDADPFLISYGITTLELSHARHQLPPAVLQARRRQIYTATYRARHRQKLAANRERKRHFAPDTDHEKQRKRLMEEMRGATSRRRAARRQCKHLESRLWRFWSCHVVYRALVSVQ